jgi:hypothetical protein
VSNLWAQLVFGGSLRKITDFKTDFIYNYAFSRDGKQLALSRGQTFVNVVTIRNFLSSDSDAGR